MAQQKAVDAAVDEVDDLIDELQPGAKLLKGQYTITRYINSGGFGITYLAKDSLDRDVVIKECFPSSVCRRSKVVVAARSRAHTAELRSIIQLFVREARNLAKIVHPNIVAVHQVFEDNGTAYMAIDFIDGLDLQQIIDGEGEKLSAEHIVRITEKLLAAVGFIHDHDMLHRDISPDNVLIDKSGEPILIDFGAAREHASKTTRAMSALRVVKDGYSPQEFYIAGSEQGPWSDLYALAATLYHLISGEAPANGQARLAALAEDRPDPYVPLTGRITGYPPGYLEAIDRALNTLPKLRVQSAAEWLAMFVGQPVAAAAPEGVEAAVLELVSTFKAEQIAEPAATPDAPLAKAASRVPATPVQAPVSRGKSPVQLVAGVAAALVVVTVGYMLIGAKPVEVTTDQAAATPLPAPTDAATALPAPDAGPAADPAPAPETAVTEASAPDAATSEPTAPATSAAAETTATSATEPQEEAATPEAEVATAEPAAEPAATAPAAAEGADANVATAAASETTAPAEAEPVTEPAAMADTEAAAAPAVPEAEVAAASEPTAPEAPAVATAMPAASQVGLSVWDVELPFTADDRIIGGQPTTIVLRLSSSVDTTAAGDWLAQGILIRAVNGTPTPTTSALTATILNAMQVDPDGKARLVVEYAGSDLQSKSGLLTVGAVRLVSLANGVNTRTTFADGAWKTVVTGVADPDVTTLRAGDILFRDKTTSVPLDAPDALERIMADLVASGRTSTQFSIIRNNKVGEAEMQLALDKGQ